MENETKAAARTARSWLKRKPVYLDTETTGLGRWDQIVDLALIDYDGVILIDTLVQPTKPIDPGAEAIHGISNEAVADAPPFSEVACELSRLTEDRLVLIYNATFDLRLLAQSAGAWQVNLPIIIYASCVMEVYAKFYGEWNRYHSNYTWQSQAKAARQLGLDVPADLHRALADAQLCRLIVEGMASL